MTQHTPSFTTAAVLRVLLAGVLLAAAGLVPAFADDVPLTAWTHEDFPDGVDFGLANGISWGDYDGDGWVDVFTCQSAELWRNVAGRTWELAADLDVVLPPAERRYGASFGDYDRDGLPDIGTEPRIPFWGDDRMHLLRNLGDGVFVDVASDPAIVDVQPHHNSETLCWGDVNGDGNLDAFLPVYPPWHGGPGNFFLFNQGPTGPGGAYRFTEMSAAAGLDNPPPDTSRPEGAQFVDVDFDGDIDLFSNGTLYRNVSSRNVPAFDAMTENGSGIGLRSSLDEGAMLFDYDLDGDFDVVAAYVEEGVRIWENHGDGTFFAAEPGIVDSPFDGTTLGMSAEDWDNDGDVDFTTRHVLRRNRLVEDGVRHFAVATHGIPAAHLLSATPAWADWDRDGDLDCALGNWNTVSGLYENTLYGPETPQTERRYLRVRPVADAPAVPRGLEVEYGAAAEIRALGGSDPFRRKKFVASSHGYLNQNEYALHFALPEPAGAASEDGHVSIEVDFPGLPADGLWRVDRHVNPALGEIAALELADREVAVYRCGGASIDGVHYPPLPFAPQTLRTTTGGLALAGTDEALPPPEPAPASGWYVGLAFDTLGASGDLHVREILLDGQLDAPVACADGTSNLALWDVTGPGTPTLVDGANLSFDTSERNRRSYFPADIVLAPGRSYRLVARVTELRGSPTEDGGDTWPIAVHGGLSFRDVGPCTGTLVAGAAVDAERVYAALRFAPVSVDSSADPIGDTLRVEKDVVGRTRLVWPDVAAAGYHVMRCHAGDVFCTPEFHAPTRINLHVETEPDAPPGSAELLWYRVEAVNECTAALHDGDSGAPGAEDASSPMPAPHAKSLARD